MLQKLIERFEIVVQGRGARVLGYVWLAAASLTWLLCPPPHPTPARDTTAVHYSNAAGYLIECVSLWPLIAFSTLEDERANLAAGRNLHASQQALAATPKSSR